MKTEFPVFHHLKRLSSKISIKVLKKNLRGFDEIESYFSSKQGLEIGGPSSIFEGAGILPVYPLSKSVDGCNFSSSTLWEAHLSEGDTYASGNKHLGYQYIKDASDLAGIENEKYDFVLSCHSLEHIANPFKALSEWTRVLKKGGIFLLVLPDKRYNFDHRRPFTTFAHLQNDFDANVSESDLTHLEEILSLHDLNKDRAAGNAEEFKKRSQLNFEHRGMHHHVFSFDLLEQIFRHFRLRVVLENSAYPFHMIVAGIKQ